MDVKPSMIKVAGIARSRQIVADHLVLGLVTGGFLGGGIVIDERDSHSIRFSKAMGILTRLPDRGEIVLSEDSSGNTTLECRLWCRGMGLRRWITSCLIGVLVALIASLAFGWLLHWSIPSGCGVAVAHDLLARWQQRSSLGRQIEGFIGNMTYLKSM